MKFKKITSILIASLLAFSVSACSSGNQPAPQPETAGSQPPPSQGQEAQPPSGAQVLKIYNSKGENAAQFTEMTNAYGQEKGITVEAFSVGSGTDHMEPLRAEMASKTPPVIFSIQGLKELIEWKEGGFVLDFNSVSDPDFKQFAESIPQGLRLTDDGVNSFGVPYNVEGYGYIVDTQMLSDIFGPGDKDKVLEAIKEASYDEWEKLVQALDTYIKTPTAMIVTLNGQKFTFEPTKTGLAQNLTGVFAVMGSQKWTYGDHFVNVALNAAFANPAAANAATSEQLDKLESLFITYAKALDMKTSHLAGADGSEVRGPKFVSETNFGYDQAIQIFADGKAVFLKQGNWAYENIKNVNPEVAARLEFLPVKMPYSPADIHVDGLSIEHLNRSIPVFVPNYYAINAKATPEEQKLAMDFLIWLNTTDEGKSFVVDSFNFIPYNADPASTSLPNSLGNSILSYLKTDSTLAAPYLGAPASWSGDTLGLKLMESYMTKEKWTEADYKDIANYAINSWKELKNQ